MVDKKTFELINAGVDGELSTRQRERLDRLRVDEPDVAVFYEETAAVGNLVRDLPHADPPDDLNDRIMRALPFPARSQAAARSTGIDILGAFKALLAPQPALRIAFGFAVGLIAGVGLMLVAPLSNGVDPSQVVGTVGAGADDGAATAVFEFEEFQGTVRVVRVASEVTLSVDGTARKPVDVEIAYTDSDMRLRGFTDREGGSIGIVTSPGEASLSLRGSNKLLLNFDLVDVEHAAFAVSLRVDGQLLTTKDLIR